MNWLLASLIATQLAFAQSVVPAWGRLSLEQGQWYLYAHEGAKELPQEKFSLKKVPFQSERRALSDLIVDIEATVATCEKEVTCLNVTSIQPRAVEPLSAKEMKRIEALLTKTK